MFPCGAFYDSAKNHFVVSYGINDVDCGYIKLPLADMMEVTKVIRPKRDVVNKANPPKLDDVLDPIPQRHKLKRNKKTKYDKLAERLNEDPEIGPEESA